ncbi:hypothetical protein BaGK_12850 [Bacillus atrophaeus]|nr:hypothetical protein BaGK_12850 [Bacillus atrophaeus]
MGDVQVKVFYLIQISYYFTLINQELEEKNKKMEAKFLIHQISELYYIFLCYLKTKLFYGIFHI